MMLFPGYRKCSLLEQTVARRFDDLQERLLPLSEEVNRTAHRIDALLGVLNSAMGQMSERTQGGLKAVAEEVRSTTGRFDALQGLLSSATDQMSERIQGGLQAVSEEVKSTTGRIDALQGLLYSYFDYINPELPLVIKGGGLRRILLIGYYGGDNLGDELMLRIVLKALGEFPSVRITVMLCENPDYDSSSLGDVDIIHYCRTTADLSHIASEFDALFIGGGALLDDVAYPWCANHFKSLSFIVAELPRYFKAKNKVVVGYGLSANGVIEKGRYGQLLSEVVTQADYFSVRDAYSLSTLARCGVPTENVRVVDDIVLCGQELCEEYPMEISDDCITVGIVWVSFSELQQSLLDTIQGVFALGAKFKKAIRVNLIPFYDFKQADTTFYETASRLLPSSFMSQIKVIGYDNSLSETVRKLSTCDVVISMRYHAALICASQGIPLVAVKLANHRHYQNKMMWVANEFPGHTTLLDSLATADEIANRCARQYERGRGAPLSKDRILCNVRELKAAVRVAVTG